MRAGGCSLQQGLTTEAAGVVKQAIALARRRGHAQVTPLHVAHTMLAASTGLLRQACLQSQAQCHPLQCKALELCFNVALNRLPASNSSPMLGGHHHHHHHHSQNPSISNALIAAFKRAQAHQRRGSIENQQQPLLAVKIELEQLIISILDDPSVSRVMREAGFSSTLVKSNVEQAVSLEICSQTTPNNNNSATATNNNKSSSSSKEGNLLVLSHQQQSKPAKPAGVSDPIRGEDVASVVESLASNKRRSIVVVGECLSSIEGVVRGVMEKVEKDDVPEGLRDVKFIPFSLSSFGNYSRVEVEQKFVELKSLLRSCMAKGVILYLGDLKWATEYRASTSSNNNNTGDYSQHGRGYYCPVEHIIMELGKLVCGIGEHTGRFWLMGIATFQTYMRCKSGHPSLETIWGIHPLTVPAGSLRLTLVTNDSELKSDESSIKNGTSKSLGIVESREKQLSCCAECSAKFEAEARSLRSTTDHQSTTSSNLPPWLQHCKNDTKGLLTSKDQNCAQVADLCRKWNSFCYSTHQQPNSNISDKTLITFSSSSSAYSGFSYDHHHHRQQQNQNPNVESWPAVSEAAKHPWRHQNYVWEQSEYSNKAINIDNDQQPSLRMFIPEGPNQKPPFSSNPNSTPTSASSSDVVMETEYSQRFKELNAENLKTLCNALEKKVPWQKDIIPEIASTILKCRSGMVRRKLSNNKNTGVNIPDVKEETWLFFQGLDMDAKEKIAKELARLVFGSQNDFVSIALSSFSSSTRADSSEDCGRNVNKRARDEQSCSYIERLGEAVSFNPHRVFLVEDVEQADFCSQMGFKRAIERGRVANSSGEEVDLRDAIVILSCESFSSRSRACSPTVKQKMHMESSSSDHQDQDDHADNLASNNNDSQVLEETMISPCVSLDLNISFDDNDESEDQTSIDDIGLLESVDRRIIFKIQEL